MGFLDMFKKKKVPDQLPDLATDEIEERLDNKELEEKKEIVNKLLKSTDNDIEIPVNESLLDKDTQNDYKENPIEKQISETNGSVLTKKEPERQYTNPLNILPKVEENSFFNKLQDSLSEEIGDIDDLEKWYNKKFLPRNIVSEMRDYWENQKTNSVIKLLGKNIQERISEKVIRLQELEKQWQDVYFDLIEKEEEIKDEEGELKKIIAEFIDLCKRKKKEQQSE